MGEELAPLPKHVIGLRGRVLLDRTQFLVLGFDP